jgi:hypothetical protein
METQGDAMETQGDAMETQGDALGSFVCAPSGRGFRVSGPGPAPAEWNGIG